MRRSLPADALRYYAQALDLYRPGRRPDPALEIDLAIGLGTAQRQTGDPAFRDTLLDAARRAADLGDTERLVAAALANDRGFYSAVGAIDTDKVEILELALARLSADTPDRALVLATLCSELAYGSPLERRQALADEAAGHREASGDDAIIVRVLNHVLRPAAGAVPPGRVDRPDDRRPRPGRADRRPRPRSSGRHNGVPTAAARAGDIDEMDRCIELHGSMAEQLDQPMFTWDHTFLRALQAQIAGDTERAESLATEALQIGTDGGQPDAAIIFGAQFIDREWAARNDE